MNKTYIKRPYYIDKISPFIDKDIIKVLVGQRRVGKSYLLLQIIDIIKERDKNANIIYINKELYEFEGLRDYKDLISYVNKNSKTKRKNFLFIDEVHEIAKFEVALRDLNAAKKYDIYCTGSNAELLSGELATYLSGRHIEIPVYSLSFSEFLTFHKIENNQESLFKYIKYGGMPYLINLEMNDIVVYDYLRNIYNTIILKDVIARYKVRNVDFLERLVEYLADNLGSFVSAKKISDFLKSQKVKMSPNIILNYLSFLNSSFAILKVPRMDVVGKKIFEINEKYYFEDLGIRHAVVGYRQTDINKILENLVFSYLKYLEYKIYTGKLGDNEIDFVAEKNGERIYVQVAYLINNDKTKKREFENFLSIRDNFPKFVVSMDEMIEGKYKGVKHVHIRDFIGGKVSMK